MQPSRWSRLSEAEIWGRQRSFYEQVGPEAFQPGGIPFQITSNPAISHAYASMVAAWIGDWYRAGGGGIHPGEPIYILELGPGAGQFTFFFTQDLRRILERNGLGHLRTCHVCADLSGRLLGHLAEHEALEPLVKEGLLDFAILDAANPVSPTLLRAERTLARNTVANPLIVIANYVFDSIPQDCFSAGGGCLYESTVQLEAIKGDCARDARVLFRQSPTTMPYYGDPELDCILASCARRDEPLILFPVAGLKLLKWLWELAGGRLLLLAADKGYQRGDVIAYPAVEFHGENCLSMMVNFGALEEFWVRRGGRFHLPQCEFRFLTIAAAEAGLPPAASAGLAQNFSEHIVDRSPEDWDVWSWRAVRDAHLYSVAEILACLRLSRWDPAVFRDFFPALLRAATGISEPERGKVIEATRRSLARYYHLKEIPNLAFQGGSLLYELGVYSEALAAFERSQRLSGPLPVTSFQIGRCLYRLGRKAEALQAVRSAIDTEPNFEDYLLATGILPERRAAGLAAMLEWETSLGMQP
jgi:tetratricopeptide (TPR) repeat protein